MAHQQSPEEAARTIRIMRSIDPILGLKHFGPPEPNTLEERELHRTIQRRLELDEWEHDLKQRS